MGKLFCAIALVVIAFFAWGGVLIPKAGQLDRPWYVGVNLAGAEFGEHKFPGKVGKDYTYPTEGDIKYFVDLGFNTFRLPFLWERLQPELNTDFEPGERARLDKVVDDVTRRSAHIILDPHNYAKYRQGDLGTPNVPISAFADFWRRLAKRYKNNSRVIFGLMNEPHQIRADRWRLAADAAIRSIRDTGAMNLILVPGTIWSGAHSWLSPRRGISNAQAFRALTDPGGNFAFEVHQYFDRDYSGTTDHCQDVDVGVRTLEKFTLWLRRYNHRGFLGEFGSANTQVCLEALDRMMRYVRANADVWIGWTYWAAGAWWGDYRFSVHPSGDGKIKPQLEILKKYLATP